MLRSTDRILTTHTGSLPRPALLAEATDDTRDELVAKAVVEVVQQQVAAGIDVVGDGEVGKPSYVTYITERAEGFGGQAGGVGGPSEAAEFPDWAQAIRAEASEAFGMPACIGPISRKDGASSEEDANNLNAAIKSAGAKAGFLTSASPGVVTMFLENQYYPSHAAYLDALVPVMRTEYESIHASGLALQVDCPDLAGSRHGPYAKTPLDEWKRIIEGHIEALNEATSNIPPQDMRLHLCWGNYEGPHVNDVALREVLPIVFKARPTAISFESANPRHAHEWQVFEELALPEDKVIVPGVIDSTTNYVEHPEVVAERILKFASVVPREQVAAGTACGFATFAGHAPVFPTVAYAKLKSLADGAAIASDRLWN